MTRARSFAATSLALRLAASACLVSLLGPGARSACAAATPRAPAISVVRAAGDRVYLAAPDSGAMERGFLVTFVDRGRTIASGEIERVVDGTLASVRLSSGSLARVKKLERLRVFAERPSLSPAPSLRVGYPAGARANLAVPCSATVLDRALEARGYRVAPAGADTWRGVRAQPADSIAPWPDTLVVRAYREAADEEIALERGELDVAVFWPGELSARMRADPRGRDALRGVRARGVIAALEPVAHTPDDSAGAERLADAIRADAPLAALGPQLFGGDLLQWSEIDTAGAASASREARAHALAPVTVDATLPGQRVIQRFLDRDLPATFRGTRRAVHLAYLDLAVAGRDSLRAEWRARGIVPLYAIRCPVLCAPERRAYVRALGADAFADLPSCDETGRLR